MKQCVLILLQVQLVHQEEHHLCHHHFHQHQELKQLQKKDVVKMSAPVQLERDVPVMGGLAKYVDGVQNGVGGWVNRVCKNVSLTKERKHLQQLSLKFYHHHPQGSN